MQLDKTIGPELHRIKPFNQYDKELFNKLFELSKPVIRNLIKNIDDRRYNVSKDIIFSYFSDKVTYIFNRYYEECGGDFEFLKAHILKGLTTYKYHILQDAYTDRAKYYQSLTSLDELYDNSKGDISNEDDNSYKEELLKILYDYMGKHLSPDAMLVFECLMTPIDFFMEKTDNNRVKVTNGMIAEFFELPKTKSSLQYISDLRHDIEYWEQRAVVDLGHK